MHAALDDGEPCASDVFEGLRASPAFEATAEHHVHIDSGSRFVYKAKTVRAQSEYTIVYLRQAVTELAVSSKSVFSRAKKIAENERKISSIDGSASVWELKVNR